MRQAALMVTLVFLCVGLSVTAEAQDDPKQLEPKCDAGDLRACVRLGGFYNQGLFGLKQEPARAVSLFERACSGGNPEGCENLGWAYQIGSGVGPDMSRALKFYQKACDGKYALGCDRLGDAYHEGRGVGQDYTRASALFERACDLGHANGCESVADLADPRRNQLPDAKRWATFLEKKCDLGGSRGGDTCLTLGLHYDLGFLVPKDPNHANDLFKKACLYENKEACKLIVRK